MKTLSSVTLPHPLTDQPTGWPLFYLMPKTHYVKRQRAANAPQYNYIPEASVTHYAAQSRKLSFLQCCKNRLTAFRRKIWISAKLAGRLFVHKLVKWFVLPLTIAACFSIVVAEPAELPERDFNLEEMIQVD